MLLRRGAMLFALLRIVAHAPGAWAEVVPEITLEGALELARTHAPEAGAARLRVDESRGRLEGASVLLRENPTLGIGVGPRLTTAGVAVDAELSQTFELGGRRSARVEGAEAGVQLAQAARDEALRRVLRETGVAFYRALHASQRLELAVHAEALAVDTLRIAERRHQVGDVPVLHVNIARGALARARSERRSAEAGLTGALGDLRILTGMDAKTPFTVKGALAARARFERVATAKQPTGERPDVRIVAAGIREAEADLRLGRGLGWPDLGLGVLYTQEEAGSSAILGTLSLTLPIFERGQGVRAEARARERRLRFEFDSARRRGSIEVDTALAVYRKRVESAAELEAIAALQEENEALARRSYEMGELGLADLLLVRREVLETRVDFLGRQLEAATAGIELEAAAGVLK